MLLIRVNNAKVYEYLIHHISVNNFVAREYYYGMKYILNYVYSMCVSNVTNKHFCNY